MLVLSSAFCVYHIVAAVTPKPAMSVKPLWERLHPAVDLE